MLHFLSTLVNRSYSRHRWHYCVLSSNLDHARVVGQLTSFGTLNYHVSCEWLLHLMPFNLAVKHLFVYYAFLCEFFAEAHWNDSTYVQRSKLRGSESSNWTELHWIYVRITRDRPIKEKKYVSSLRRTGYPNSATYERQAKRKNKYKYTNKN